MLPTQLHIHIGLSLIWTFLVSFLEGMFLKTKQINQVIYTRRKLWLIDHILFFEGVTWGKVVSLYAVAGALAVDCVRHGHPAMIHTIVDCMGEFIRKSLISWLKRRGGWVRGTLCFCILTWSAALWIQNCTNFSTANQFRIIKLVIYLVEHSCKVFTEKCDFL